MTLNLLIDTSSPHLILGLAKNGVLEAEWIELHDNKLAAKLVPAIEKFLIDNGISKNDLTFISLGMGPGSYTGTRAGAAVAKTLAFALNIPLISLFSPLFFMKAEKESRIGAVLVSKTPSFFLTLYDLSQKKIDFFPHLSETIFHEHLTSHGTETLFAAENFPITPRISIQLLTPHLALAASWAYFLFSEEKTAAPDKLLYFQEIL